MGLAWIKKLLKKSPIEPIFPETITQYTYVQGTDQQQIKILNGDYNGVEFQFGHVKITEENKDEPHINFDYEIINSPNEGVDLSPEKVTILFGDIIMNILEREMEKGGLENGRNYTEDNSS